MQNLLNELKTTLQSDERLIIDGQLVKNKVVELALAMDEDLLVRTETVWCNFSPAEVHYHTYAGIDRTDRQRIKRKAERWAARYEKLPHGERQAVLSAMLQTRAT